MKKKWIIAICSLTVLVGLIILLALTVFSLKTVKLDFRTSTSYISQTDEEIIESARFKKGKTVLIHNKKEYIKRLEDFNPYIKVINIETVFPSTFVVHLAERQEVFAVAFDGGHYICDQELRVLKTEGSYISTSSNAILLSQEGVEVENNIKVGEYLTSMRSPSIYNALYENNRVLGDQKSLIESVELTTEFDNALKQHLNVTILKYFSGQTFKIINDEYGLKYKTKLMNEVYAQLFTFIGKTIVDEEQNQIVLTEDNLKDCEIVINNYYDNKTYKEKDCYFNIIIKQ